MHPTRTALATVVLALVIVLSAAPPIRAGAQRGAGDDSAVPSVVGFFEGEWISLADGWGDARACTSDDGRTARCYRSEAEMDEAEGPARSSLRGAEARAACSGPVRLYRLANFGGSVLQLSAQNQFLNLASYGFDNDTSSYRIGPCAARFYDVWPSGGLYPGPTSAWIASVSMVGGWDNRISSVYIT